MKARETGVTENAAVEYGPDLGDSAPENPDYPDALHVRAGKAKDWEGKVDGGFVGCDDTDDWLYRELGQVSRVIEECRAGHYATYYRPGHPHGSHTHIYRIRGPTCLL